MAEEYTKISTPRQEVLFKKGSIGAKKRVATTPTASTGTAANDSGSEQDSVNGNAVSPVSPPVGDADSFQYGNLISLILFQIIYWPEEKGIDSLVFQVGFGQLTVS